MNDLVPLTPEQVEPVLAAHNAESLDVSTMFEDSQNLVVPSDEALGRVQGLVQIQLDLEDRIRALDAELKQCKEALEHVQETELPSALQAYGMTDIGMKDGSRVTIKQEYYATIKEEQKATAFDWLIKNGHADLIKHDITTTFTKGQDDEANQVMELLQDNNVDFVDKKHVHPQTLRAFVREQIEDGKPIPLETFSVHVRQVAKIQRERK